jgi:hypothetical protein
VARTRGFGLRDEHGSTSNVYHLAAAEQGHNLRRLMGNHGI